MRRPFAAASTLIGILSLACYFHSPTPTVLSVRIGQPYLEVVSGSTFPVEKLSNSPIGNSLGFGVTWVTKPAVILIFNDPQHGFILPPTTFATIGYMDGIADDIATSPMLKKLPFDEAVDLLAQLQAQFQAGGWRPWPNNGSTWYDFSPAGRTLMHQHMLSASYGWAEEQWLFIPGKYSMTFRIKCAEDCERMGPDRYLIDIGISKD
jgi:hypothetical protein